MKLTEMDRLKSDLKLLTDTRNKLGEIKDLAKRRNRTAAMIRFRVCWMIGFVDRWIGEKKDEIAEEEIRERLKEGRRGNDKTTMGAGAAGADRAPDPADAVDHDGRHEEDLLDEQQRPDGGSGRGDYARQAGAMCGVSAGQITGTAEEILRARNHERSMMDWQLMIMEADREGRHERLVL